MWVADITYKEFHGQIYLGNITNLNDFVIAEIHKSLMC